MQSDAKKQIPVLVALSLVLVLAVGYSVKKTLHRPAPQEAPAARAAGEAATTDAPEEASAAPAGDAAAPGAEQMVFSGAPPRDPFRPVIRPDQNEPAGGMKIYKAPSGNGASSGKGSRSGGGQLPIPPLPLPGLSQGLRVEGPGVQAPSAPEPPPFTATGVVRGAFDIAILRGEGGSRYFVREGQSVGDGYVVKSISPVGVVLKKQDRSVFLKVGGAQDASSTSRPRQEGE